MQKRFNQFNCIKIASVPYMLHTFGSEVIESVKRHILIIWIRFQTNCTHPCMKYKHCPINKKHSKTQNILNWLCGFTGKATYVGLGSNLNF